MMLLAALLLHASMVDSGVLRSSVMKAASLDAAFHSIMVPRWYRYGSSAHEVCTTNMCSLIRRASTCKMLE